ncbi:hypothetical protein VNO78_06468 [Psophocarpus tetragonolobus]|uniref:Uncharacterized protein n=1 Tax=Psophocarpus tetragonolobus TaxID=3891 RepID=A0AAN9SSC0_PSOTE
MPWPPSVMQARCTSASLSPARLQESYSWSSPPSRVTLRATVPPPPSIAHSHQCTPPCFLLLFFSPKWLQSSSPSPSLPTPFLQPWNLYEQGSWEYSLHQGFFNLALERDASAFI